MTAGLKRAAFFLAVPVLIPFDVAWFIVTGEFPLTEGLADWAMGPHPVTLEVEGETS